MHKLKSDSAACLFPTNIKHIVNTRINLFFTNFWECKRLDATLVKILKELLICGTFFAIFAPIVAKYSHKLSKKKLANWY